jgi:hypothetical protein
LDDRTIVPTETRPDQTIGAALLREQLEHVARRSTGQDVPAHVTVEAGVRLRELLQRRSPVTSIPPEILAYIFELYVSRLGELTPDGAPAQGPFYLAQVCKLWRAVAESDPHLWTSIHFYFPESHQSREDNVPGVKPVFDLHLKRSGALPISFTFTDHRIYHPATDDLISLLVDRLRTHARRWKSISLQLSCGYFPLLFTFTSCDLSSLEHIDISGDVVFTQRITELPLNLESATNLKSFTYSGPGPSVDDSINLHWESLAEVSFEFAPHRGRSFTLSRQFRHLAQCQNISICSLGIDRTWRLNGSQTITLPCLQTLRVRRLSPDAHARGAIDLFILPQLQTLEIDASTIVIWNEHWHDRTFSDLLTRSGCTLLHLSIQDVDFPNDELVRCLALSPALTSLRFIPCPRSQNISDVIRKMDVSRTPTGGQTRTQGHRQRRVSNSGPLVPQLREITLASSVEGYLDLMMKMLRSRVGTRARAAGVAALRRVEVVFFDLWHDTEVDRVRVPGARLGRVASFREDLARWVSENRNENEQEDKVGNRLEASVVVDSPYLAEYINVR